ncbi:MAG: hypothetical protein ACI9PP_001524 [Halobacteriales archaeon]|jgi:hypothetical protein
MIDENVGETNRLLRLGFGAIGVFSGVALVTLLQQSFGGGLLIMAGVILLITAVLRRCPVTRALTVDIQSNDGR